jgi:DNA-binding NarL/FixJ family response regulator
MIRVAITDDHQLIINGIREIIEHLDGVELVGQWLDAASTKEHIRSVKTDILFLDINLPDQDGIHLCRELLKDQPDLKIIALTTYNQTIMVKNMMKSGALGYLLKNTSKEEIREAIDTVLAGNTYLQQELVDQIEQESKGVPPNAGFIPRLTRREKEVLVLITEEMTTKEIAEKLFVSTKTVETHRLHLIQKFGVRNTAGLVKEAFNKGLID